MKRALVAVTFLLLLVVALAGYLRVSAAPIRDAYAPDAVKQPKPGTELPLDAKIQSAVRRAEFDYFVYPVPRFGRRLVFLRAMVCPPNDIYLQFGIQGEIHVWVMYRCAGDGRLLWKTMIVEGS